jgi:hypothetical protein
LGSELGLKLELELSLRWVGVDFGVEFNLYRGWGWIGVRAEVGIVSGFGVVYRLMLGLVIFFTNLEKYFKKIFLLCREKNSYI